MLLHVSVVKGRERNHPCPCGSGKKFKRCCGFVSAAEVQRVRQQGQGKPITSNLLPGGVRVVAAGEHVYSSPQWGTFHEFLIDYLPLIFGAAWWSDQIRRKEEERHRVVLWHALVGKVRSTLRPNAAGAVSAPMTGAAAAYLRLAYDLHTLANNAEIDARLLERLKNSKQFPGAHYEVAIAAACIRAGFDVTFEDEQDRRTSHCEFTATSRQSGCRYSVEAKHREPPDAHQATEGRLRIRRRLHMALGKRAQYERVVFIDVNVLDSVANNEMPAFLHGVLEDLRASETKPPDRTTQPRAYVFVTNHPFQYDLEGTRFRTSVLAEGFKIPDFKSDAVFHDVRDVLRSRAAHSDMHRLLSSLQEHAEIPATFDGDIPELAFGRRGGDDRLLVGRTYLVPDADGAMQPGTLRNAAVLENERSAYGTFELGDGRVIIVRCPLSEPELEAYRRFPQTFFGIVEEPRRTIHRQMDMFDFIYDSYKHTPKETLLRFLAAAPDWERLRTLPQEELAILYSERCAAGHHEDDTSSTSKTERVGGWNGRL